MRGFALTHQATQSAFGVARRGVDQDARLLRRARRIWAAARVDPFPQGGGGVSGLERQSSNEQMREGMQKDVSRHQLRSGLFAKARLHERFLQASLEFGDP